MRVIKTMGPAALLVGLALENGAGDGAEHITGLICQNTNPLHESGKVVGKERMKEREVGWN